MPKSVLPYELDKGQYFDPETSFTQSCFPNKKKKRKKESTILNTMIIIILTIICIARSISLPFSAMVSLLVHLNVQA